MDRVSGFGLRLDRYEGYGEIPRKKNPQCLLEAISLDIFIANVLLKVYGRFTESRHSLSSYPLFYANPTQPIPRKSDPTISMIISLIALSSSL